MTRRTRFALPALALTGLLLSGCAGAPQAEPADAGTAGADFPLTLTNCGTEVTLTSAPSKVVTLNQGATEVVLALGLGDQLAGTAHLDDAVSPVWAEEYAEVPVLSKEYPTNEELLATGADLFYASYASAFDPKVAGTRAELTGRGVGSYLSPFGCEEKSQRPEASFDSVWGEVSDVAGALGHPEAATALVAEQRAELTELAEAGDGEDLDVFWWDGGTKAPNVGAGDGGPALVMEAVGAENVFDDLAGSWAEGNWEDVLAADPDVIVLVDAAWDPAEEKKAHLTSDPVLSQLRAVQQERFVVVPFSASTAGVRLVEGARTLAEGLRALEQTDDTDR